MEKLQGFRTVEAIPFTVVFACYFFFPRVLVSSQSVITNGSFAGLGRRRLVG